MRTLKGPLLSALLVATSACDATNYQRIDEHFEFGYTDRTDYTNVYCGGLPVIPGGCDEAKWAGDLIVARGLRSSHPYDWSPQAKAVPGPMLYFIIHKTEYLTNTAAQELNDGFEGPLSEAEFSARDPLPKKPFRTTKDW
ncbi:hypothetical protein [Hymenobacter arizonensis]|uniref:Uncharacterized protein n=1 Tax=Hymenobacter arizonensis TaxID=1227077 RepID=A0A1I6BNA0_HYMAR|nr:hypothetical protein [Hymenobacter arizonensis]SFQ82406.1 hypothetical protein SAMN04515668_4804 [Hymenobacter arizonensis]